MTRLPSAEFFLMAGLVLDIVGVLILAVPDIPRVARLFKFGKLRAARSALQYGGLEPGDTGFEQVVAIHDRSQPNTETTPDMVEYIEYGPQVKYVHDRHEGEDGPSIPSFAEGVAAYDVENRVTFQFSNKYPRELDFNVEMDSPPPGRVHAKINELIERGERNWRIFGLSCIATGFISQLVAAYVG